MYKKAVAMEGEETNYYCSGLVCMHAYPRVQDRGESSHTEADPIL